MESNPRNEVEVPGVTKAASEKMREVTIKSPVIFRGEPLKPGAKLSVQPKTADKLKARDAI